MLRMDLALFEAPAGHEFITSDVPVTWFDPDFYKRPPAYQSLGLAYPNVEVRMPVSPRLILNISHHTELDGRRFLATGQMVEEFNRVARFECYEHFVTQSNRKNDYWFFDMQPPA
jgi:hypothetical protein